LSNQSNGIAALATVSARPALPVAEIPAQSGWVQMEPPIAPFRWESFIGFFKTHRGVWLTSFLVLLGLFGLISFFGFHDQYRSETVFLVDEKQPAPILFSSSAAGTSGMEAGGLFSVDVPLKIQLEILHSPAFMSQFYSLAKERHNLPPNINSPEAMIKEEIVKAEGLTQTNFIRLTARAPKPRDSQQLVQTYFDSFKSFYRSYHNYNTMKRIDVLKSRMEEATNQIIDQKNKIQAYEAENGVTESGAELDNLLKQIGLVASNIGDTRSNIAKDVTFENSLQTRLGMDPQTALNASAAGQNGELSQLKKLQMTYKANQKELTENHPVQQQLKRDIDALEKKYPASASDSSGKTLKGSFSLQVASDLLKAEAEANALKASLESQNKELSQLETQLKSMPEKEGKLFTLVNDMEALGTGMNNLKAAYEELKLQTQYDQIAILTPPTLPNKVEPPSLFFRFKMSLLLALLLPTLWLVFQFNWLRTHNANSEFIHKILGIPVLSKINLGGQYPVLPYRQTQTVSFERAVRQTCYLLQQQKEFLLNPFLLCMPVNSSGNVFMDQGFVQKLAIQLAQSGDRVLVLNFFNPLFKSYSPSENSYSEAVFPVEDLIHFPLHESSSQSFAHLVTVETQSKWPLSQFIQGMSSLALEHWIQQLRGQYEWIFMVLPPLAEEPGNLVLLPKSQGVLLDVGIRASHQAVEAACIQIHQAGGHILGAISEEL